MSKPPKSEEELLKMKEDVEVEILDAIRKGDLEKLGTFKFRAEGIDAPVATKRETLVYPSRSKEVHIERVAGPTVVVYAILCEQPDVLKFFLSKFQPDMGMATCGWTPLHFACATRDVSCLRLLLEHKDVQNNINLGFGSEVGTTTALHVAVQHRIHEAVLLLTKPFPQIRYPVVTFWKIENDINLSALNALGSTALHIAVRDDDWDMIQILINAGANLSVMDKDGRSAFDLAKSLGLSRLCGLLEESEIEPQEVLDARYIHSREDDLARNKFFDALEKKIGDVHRGLDLIQEKIEQQEKGLAKGLLCTLCNTKVGRLCPECNQQICAGCWTNPMHRCETRYPGQQ